MPSRTPSDRAPSRGCAAVSTTSTTRATSSRGTWTRPRPPARHPPATAAAAATTTEPRAHASPPLPDRRRPPYGGRRPPADQGLRLHRRGRPRRGHRLPHHGRPAAAVQRGHLPHRPLRRRRRQQDHHQPPPPRHRPAAPAHRGPHGLLPPLVALLGHCADPDVLERRRVRGRADHRRRLPLPHPVTVRDDRPADLLLLLPDITWQAYNLYPEDGRRRARASTTRGTRTAGCSARPKPPRRCRSTARTRARASPSTSATPTTSSAGPSATATTSRTPTPATCTQAASTPPATAASSSRAATSTGRRPCAEHAVETAREHRRVPASSSPPTPCTDRAELGPSPSGVPDRLLTWRSAAARRTRTVAWGQTAPSGLGAGRGGPGPGPQGAPSWSSGRRRLPLGIDSDRRQRGRGDELGRRRRGRGRNRCFPRIIAPARQGRILLSHSLPGHRGSHPPPGSVLTHTLGALVFAAGTFAWSPALDRPGLVDTRVQRATADLPGPHLQTPDWVRGEPAENLRTRPWQGPVPPVRESDPVGQKRRGGSVSGFVEKPEPVEVPGLAHLHTGKVRDLSRTTRAIS